MSRILSAVGSSAALFIAIQLISASFILIAPARKAYAQDAPQRSATMRRRSRSTEGQRGAARNPEIARMISEVDARNIERTILKLVSFGTRNTLSTQDDPVRGIGAARDWLYGEFQKIAAQTGGRMTAEKQSYLQEAMPPPQGRVPQPTTIT